MLKSGALMTDENGELVMINTIARSLLGLSDTETITIQDIGQLESDKNIASIIQTAFAQAESMEEKVVLGGNGGKQIKLDVAPVIDPNGMKIGTVVVLSRL
jgi:signal transduction histidine kinase